MNQPASLQADYAAWSLIFGTEALVKEQRHRDRLEILESNPLLLHAWYETCKEAGVPVREFGNRTEEEMEEFTQKVSTQVVAELARQAFSGN